MSAETQKVRILEVLNREGALSNKRISEVSGVPYGTVRCYTSLLTRSGDLKHFKDLWGVFELTDKGRKTLAAARSGGDE